MLAIGALTPAREILRAIVLEPAPTPRCDMSTTWDRSFPQFSKATYLAAVPTLPAPIRPATVATEKPIRSSHCWSSAWGAPRFGG